MNTYKIWNFSHPLTQKSLDKLKELIECDIDVVTIPVHIDLDQPIKPQILKIIYETLENHSYPDAMVPPGLNFAATLLGRMLQHNVSIIAIKSNGEIPPQYIISEVI